MTPAHCSTSDKSSPCASAVIALEVADVRGMTASPFSEWVISQHEILSWECRAQGVCLSEALIWAFLSGS